MSITNFKLLDLKLFKNNFKIDEFLLFLLKCIKFN